MLKLYQRFADWFKGLTFTVLITNTKNKMSTKFTLNSITDEALETFETKYNQSRVSAVMYIVKELTGKSFTQLSKEQSEELDVIYSKAGEYNMCSTLNSIIKLLNK